MGTIRIAETPWLGTAIIGAVIALGLAMVLVPGLFLGTWFFGVVVLGILARTLFPWWTTILTEMKETGIFPAFQTQFYVPLVGALGLDLLGMLAHLLMTQNAIQEITVLNFTLAFMVGYGGPQVIRDGQKFIQAARA